MRGGPFRPFLEKAAPPPFRPPL